MSNMIESSKVQPGQFIRFRVGGRKNDVTVRVTALHPSPTAATRVLGFPQYAKGGDRPRGFCYELPTMVAVVD